MNNNNVKAKNTKQAMVGVGGILGTLLAISIGAGFSNTAAGLGAMTVGLVGIGCLLGYTIGFKNGRKSSVEALV